MQTDNLYVYKVISIDRVVDGDTIDCSIDLGFNVILKKRVRMAGIDAPEIETKNPKEKELGMGVKTWLQNKVLNKTNIIIKTELEDSTEKYGRILAWLYIDGECINQTLINEGYVWAYSGGEKDKDILKLKSISNI